MTVPLLSEVDVQPMTVIRDAKDNFLGHEPNEGCEHRTVGHHRAYCLDCSEWCSPNAPCVRCERAGLWAQSKRVPWWRRRRKPTPEAQQ